MTFNEAFSRYFHPDGFANFIPRYLRLLVGEMPDRDDEALVSALEDDADKHSCEMEKNAKEISTLTKKAFLLFRVILRAGDLSLDEPDLLVLQAALHESLLSTLYYIDLNCRELLELQVDYEAHDDVDDYLEYFKSKYSLSENDFDHLRQKWFTNEQGIFDSLSSREYKLKVYRAHDGQIAFQLYNDALDPVISLPKTLCIPDRLIISRYYFVLRLFDIFHHLDLITKTLQLERAGAANDLEDDLVEIDAIDAFNKAAEELRNTIV